MNADQRAIQRLAYSPSLDGLRAVAVSAVFLFHAGALSGGFVGVDVFFVISGFLITSLALSEIELTGRLALGAFWARRFRRLMPALLAVMAAVVAYSLWEGGAALRRIGDDVLATTFYVANWAQIGEGRDYFAQYESEPLLEHAWSLSVEEQFYVVWPLVIAGLVLVAKRLDLPLRRVVAGAAGVAAVASVATAMWLKGLDGTSITRLYYGTDTRAVGLAVGAVFGALVRPERIVQRVAPSRAREAVGVTALAGLAWIMLTVDGSQRWLYGPGFLLIALLSVVAIDATLGAGRLANALAVRPVVVLGRMSYGVYLWHWPVIVVLNSDRTGLSGPLLGMAWVLVTAALTALSWFAVEKRAPMPSLERPFRVAGYVGVAALLCAGAVVVANGAIASERDAEFTIPVAVSGDDSPPASTDVSEPTSTTVPAASTSTPSTVTTVLATAATVPATAAPTTLPLPTNRPLRLLIVGDSAAYSLRDGPNPIPEQAVFDLPTFGAVEILNVGRVGCSIVDEGAWVFEGDVLFARPDACSGDLRYEADLERFEPDVVLMLFGWPGTGEYRFDDGVTLAACSERFDEAWRTDYQRLVDRLGADRPVVVANIAPLTGVNAEEMEPTRCLNALVDDLDARVFDYQGWLCPDYDCAVSEALRPDDIHFRNAADLQLDVTAALVELVLPIVGY